MLFHDSTSLRREEPLLKPARVLVVDDEESLRRVMQVYLQRQGYSTEASPNGEEALRLLETADYQLVLTDLRMPGMSGLELLRAIKSQYPEIAVIILTAFGSIENAVEAMQAGAYHYVTKPVQFPELSLVEIVPWSIRGWSKKSNDCAKVWMPGMVSMP